MDGVLYRLLWAGQIATQLPKMETARVRFWFARIDESVPGQLNWGRRPSGALSVFAIEEPAGSIPKMVLGSFWRDRTQQSDYTMDDEMVVRDTYIGPQTWDVVYANDRVSGAGELRIGLDEYPLMGEDARGSTLRFQSAPLLRCRAESGLELLFTSYEVFRRFYALTTELANAVLAGSWKKELAKLVELEKTKFAEDGETFEICPRFDMRDIGCLGLAYFMTMPHAARLVSEIHPTFENARRGGQPEPWIVARPPWQKEGLQLSFIGRKLRSGSALVLWIYSSHFPEFPYSVVRIGEQLVVPILDENAPVRPPCRELQVRIDELAESSIVPAADARLSRFASHFDLNESWTDLARLTRKYTKKIYTVINPISEGNPPAKRKKRLSTGSRAETGIQPQGSLSTDAQNTVLDRFKALAECFDNLLENEWILKREDYPLVNPVTVGNFKYCAFPTKIGTVARNWSYVGQYKERVRLCWVSEITALDGSLYYWLEVETDVEAERKERFRALVVKPRAAGTKLLTESLETILKIGVIEKAQWKKDAFKSLEDTVAWKSARHAFKSGQVTRSLVLGKLHALGAPMPKVSIKVKRRG